MNPGKTALIAIACFGVAVSASAQQKQRVSFVLPPGNSKYTQQHVIDVGDVPDHKLRL